LRILRERGLNDGFGEEEEEEEEGAFGPTVGRVL